jgi:hypothetical protein
VALVANREPLSQIILFSACSREPDNLRTFVSPPLMVGALPSLSGRPMPPLSFSTEELDLLLALAAPIDQRQRDQFLHEVAAELDAAAAQTGVERGLGVLHRVGRVVQRKYFDPPELPNASPPFRRA